NTMSAPRAITVSNRGTSPLAINQITFTGANSGDFAETDNCGTPVAGGASCTVSVTFTPSTGGTESAAVSVADNAAGTPQTVPLSGTGSTNSVMLSPAFLNFGFQPPGTSSPPKTVTLSTTGTGTVTINSVAIAAGFNGDEFTQTNNCPTSMPAGSSCTISVTFAPTRSNPANATLTVNDSAARSPQVVGLTGTGAYSVVPTGPPTHWVGSDGYGAYSNSSVAVSSISSGTFGAFPGTVVVVYCGSG